MTIPKLELEKARELVLQVLSGKITPDNSPYIWDDDVLFFNVTLLEKHDSDWLFTQMRNSEYDIERRRLVVVDMSPEGMRNIADVPELLHSVKE